MRHRWNVPQARHVAGVPLARPSKIPWSIHPSLRLAPSRVGGQGLLLEPWGTPQAGRPTPSTVEPITLIMMSARPDDVCAAGGAGRFTPTVIPKDNDGPTPEAGHRFGHRSHRIEPDVRVPIGVVAALVTRGNAINPDWRGLVRTDASEFKSPLSSEYRIRVRVDFRRRVPCSGRLPRRRLTSEQSGTNSLREVVRRHAAGTYRSPHRSGRVAPGWPSAHVGSGG